MDDQRRQLSGRSIFSPAPISATITPISVRWVGELRVGQRVRVGQADGQREDQHAEGEEGDRHGQRPPLQQPRAGCRRAGRPRRTARRRGRRDAFRLHRGRRSVRAASSAKCGPAASRSAGSSYTATAPAPASSPRLVPPQVRPMQGTSMPGARGDVPHRVADEDHPRRRRRPELSQRGLDDVRVPACSASASPTEVAASITSSAPTALRSTPARSGSADDASADLEPAVGAAAQQVGGAGQRRAAGPSTPGSARRAGAQLRVPARSRSVPSRCSRSLSEPIPIERWMLAIGTSWPRLRNASHHATVCR